MLYFFFFFFSSRRRHTRSTRDWSSDVCSSDLRDLADAGLVARRLLVAAAVAIEARQLGERLHLRDAERRRLELLGRRAQQLLGLVVASLGGADDPECHLRRRQRDSVLRPNRLACLEREPLGLPEPPLSHENLRELALPLAEQAAIAEAREHAHDVAQDLLGPIELAPVLRQLRQIPPGHGQEQRVTQVLVDRRRGDKRLLGLGYEALGVGQQSLRNQRLPAVGDAAALACQLERALDEGLRPVELEPPDEHHRQVSRRDRLQIPPLCSARDLERASKPAVELVGVAQPAAHLGAREQRAEARLGIAVVAEDGQRLLDERLRTLDVRVEVERDFAEPVERTTVDVALAGLGGRDSDLLHLDPDGGHVAQTPGGAGSEVASPQRRRELDGAEQELPRAAEGLARERALAGVRERLRRQLGELRRRCAVELGEQTGCLVEVEGTDLDELVAGALGEPLREGAMQVGSRALREARVRHLADEHVLELVGLLAADRRPDFRQDEIAKQ